MPYEAPKDKILEAYKKEGRPLVPREVAKLTKVNPNTARRIIRELYNAGSLEKVEGPGKYKVKS